MLVALVACEDAGTSTPTDDGTGLPQIVLTDAEQAGYDTLIGDLMGSDGLSGSIAGYWPQAYAQMVIGSQYRPPTDVTAYEGAPQSSACGPLGTDNAWYCSNDEALYYDDNFLRTLYRAYGIAAPTIILAHEWGHHVQTVMGAPQTDVASELQADCLAGMFFGVKFLPAVGEPDLRSAGATLFILGDENYSASRWFEANVHGPASWRAKAFLDGMLGEGAYCVDYREWQERGTVTISNYRWLPAPGVTVSEADGSVTATLRGRTAIISASDAPFATTALDYIPTAFQALGAVDPVGPPTEIETGDGVGGILGGTGAVQGFQLTDGGVTQHGILFVHVATTGDAAIVAVVEPGPAPASTLEDPAWNPLLNWMFVVGFSLCPPDGGGTMCVALGGQ
jgi:hypothetical protein